MNISDLTEQLVLRSIPRLSEVAGRFQPEPKGIGWWLFDTDEEGCSTALGIADPNLDWSSTVYFLFDATGQLVRIELHRSNPDETEIQVQPLAIDTELIEAMHLVEQLNRGLPQTR